MSGWPASARASSRGSPWVLGSCDSSPLRHWASFAFKLPLEFFVFFFDLPQIFFGFARACFAFRIGRRRRGRRDSHSICVHFDRWPRDRLRDRWLTGMLSFRDRFGFVANCKADQKTEEHANDASNYPCPGIPPRPVLRREFGRQTFDYRVPRCRLPWLSWGAKRLRWRNRPPRRFWAAHGSTLSEPQTLTTVLGCCASSVAVGPGCRPI